MASFEKTDFHDYNKKNGYGLTKAQLKMWTLRHQYCAAEARTFLNHCRVGVK